MSGRGTSMQYETPDQRRSQKWRRPAGIRRKRSLAVLEIAYRVFAHFLKPAAPLGCIKTGSCDNLSCRISSSPLCACGSFLVGRATGSNFQMDAREFSKRLLPALVISVQVSISPAFSEVSQESPTVVLESIGDCAQTTVSEVAISYASTITYENDTFQVDWAENPDFRNTIPGDVIQLCLVSIPDNCPKDDTRGRQLEARNIRTGDTWSAQNSFHSCGGA